MFNNFIKKIDYKRLIQDKHINQMIENNDALLDQSELTGQQMIDTHLRDKYNTSKIFFSIQDFVSGATYVSGQSVWFGSGDTETIYLVTGATSSGNPTGGTGWTKQDNRNALIVTCLLDLSLYEIHSRISPNNIPTIREIRKSDCMEWLKAISKGKISIDLPLKDNPFFKPFATGSTRQCTWEY